MEWTDIIALINAGSWERARQEIDSLKGKTAWNDTAAIAEASVCLHENDEEGAYNCIAEGLKFNCRNYELYVMLGNYYLARNINQAYLCYENAEFYCEVEEDKPYIRQCIKDVGEQGSTVTPVSIVMVSYNNCQMMQNCIQCIRDTAPQSAYELVVVDNNSSDGIAEWLQQQSDIRLIRNMVNKGFGGGCNQGVKAAKPDNDIFFLNNDTLVPANAIFWLRMGLYENDQTGAVGSVSNCVGNRQQIAQFCQSVPKYLLYGEKNNVPDKNPYERKVWLSGFALMIKRCALDEVGLFDLRYGKGYFEDNDIGVRLRYAGYHLLLCRNSFIFHYGSQSFGKGAEINQKIVDNSLVFLDKWGFNIEDYTYPRLDILDFIKEEKDAPIRVLEIGCGMGMLLSRIKYQWRNSVIRGIETKEKVAQLGKDYLGVEWGNAELMEFPYEKNYFDYIIFSNALETFHSPEHVIGRLMPYLKNSGRMLFSIYNVMHVSALMSLLGGRFLHADAMALHKSHLCHFALRDISSVLEQCDLIMEDLQGSMEEDIMCGLPEDIKEALGKLAGNNMKLLQIFEYLVMAKKKQDAGGNLCTVN